VLRALPIAALQHPSIFLPNEPLNESSYFVETPSASTSNQRWWKDQGSIILRSSLIGAAVLFFVHPLELARTRLALDIQSPHQFAGICDCLSQIASRVKIAPAKTAQLTPPRKDSGPCTKGTGWVCWVWSSIVPSVPSSMNLSHSKQPNYILPKGKHFALR